MKMCEVLEIIKDREARAKNDRKKELKDDIEDIESRLQHLKSLRRNEDISR